MKSALITSLIPVALAGRLILEDRPNKIPNQYIVQYHPGVPVAQRQAHERDIINHGASIEHRFVARARFAGYSVRLGGSALQRVLNTEMVDTIEPDAEVYLSMPAPPAGKGPKKGGDGGGGTPPAPPIEVTWGQHRLSHPAAPAADQIYEYLRDTTVEGSDAWVYVLDTGVDTSHYEFEGRAIWGTSTVKGPNNDDNGHGTHCAGTIGGARYGVAKKTNIVAVKVLGKRGGSLSQVASGIDWVISHALDNGHIDKAIISMSLGAGGCDRSASGVMYSAAMAALASGITVVVAAGNDGDDAGNYQPACYDEVITVGAINKYDGKPTWSNFGAVVDIFAPGEDVKSAWPDNSVNTISGTSMATPHIAGLAAYLIGKGVMGPDNIRNEIVNVLATVNQGDITNLADANTVNLIAYNGGSA